jgi:hypothetical protein
VQAGRALSNQQQRSHLSCQQCEASTRPCQATTRTHETTVSASFVLFARQDGRFPTPDLDSTSCLKPSRFSYRKVRQKGALEICKKHQWQTGPPKSVFCEPSIRATSWPKVQLFRRCYKLVVQIIEVAVHSLMPSRTPLPARYPPIGTWPAVMRADMAAAYLDYRTTGELARAVIRGEAPPPTSYHGIGRARQPVWSKAAIDNFTASAMALDLDRSQGEDLSSLV